MSGDLAAHLTEVCSEFEHVCLLKSIKSRSTSAHKISSDQTDCTINWSVQWVCSHMDIQVDLCKGGFWWGGSIYMYIFTCNLTKYIYIFKNSYTYFPPNLVQKACLQALASSCKHYHSKSRIRGLRFKIQKELLESKRQDSRFKIFSGSPWIQGLAYKIEDSRFQWLFLNPGAWAQDSRFKIQKELLESKEVDSRFRIFSGFSWIQGLGYKTQDSRFKIRKELLESRPYTRLCENKRSFCILNPGPWIQEKPLKILNLESAPLDSRSSFLDLESSILNPGPWI